jgi:hypothetical protein
MPIRAYAPTGLAYQEELEKPKAPALASLGAQPRP